jgi:hypothetical protein
MERAKGTNFRLYEETTHKFILSAKLVDREFYISQYEDFPDVFDGKGNGSPSVGAKYCFVLRCNLRLRRLELFSTGCESCDSMLSRFSCGPSSPDNGDRQLLASITHVIAFIFSYWAHTF